MNHSILNQLYVYSRIEITSKYFVDNESQVLTTEKEVTNKEKGSPKETPCYCTARGLAMNSWFFIYRQVDV